MVKCSYNGVVRYKLGSTSKEEYYGIDKKDKQIKIPTQMAESIYQPVFLYDLQNKFYEGSKCGEAIQSSCSSKDLLIFDDLSIDKLKINRLAYQKFDDNHNKLEKNQWLSKDVNGTITKRTHECVEQHFNTEYVNKLQHMESEELTYQPIPAGTSRVSLFIDFDQEEENNCTRKCYKQENESTCMMYALANDVAYYCGNKKRSNRLAENAKKSYGAKTCTKRLWRCQRNVLLDAWWICYVIQNFLTTIMIRFMISPTIQH